MLKSSSYVHESTINKNYFSLLMPQLLLFEEPRCSGMRKSGKKTVLILHAAYLHTCKYHNRAKKKQFSLCLNVHRAQQSSECQFYGDYN